MYACMRVHIGPFMNLHFRHTNSLVCFIQVYAGAPIIAFNVRAWSQRLYICITVCLLAAALFCLVFVSLLCVLLLACTSAFVSFVCPMCMMWLHGFKKNISGPWDIVGEKEGDGVREFCNQ